MKASFDQIIQDPRPVVVDFFATWCGPCKAQAPILQSFASEMGDAVRVIKIDVDQNPEVAQRYGIQSIPTMMIFQAGNVRYRQPGVHQKEQLKQLVRPYLA